MLFLFKGRYALPAKLTVGIGLLGLGFVTSSRFAIVIGAVVLVMAFLAGFGSRRRALDLDE